MIAFIHYMGSFMYTISKKSAIFWGILVLLIPHIFAFQVINMKFKASQPCLGLTNLVAQTGFLFHQLGLCFPPFCNQVNEILMSLFGGFLSGLNLLSKEVLNILSVNPGFTMSRFIIHWSLTCNSVNACRAVMATFPITFLSPQDVGSLHRSVEYTINSCFSISSRVMGTVKWWISSAVRAPSGFIG